MHAQIRSRRRLLAATLAAPLAAAFDRAFAQGGWPDKPVKLVLGYPPGGAADGTARPLEPKMAAALGQSVLFDYRPGAGATIAAEFTAKAPPDGYTLHITDAGPTTILPHGKKLPYDTFTSFTPIGGVCSGGTLIVAHPSTPVKTVPELVALAKSKPGTLSYGTSGVGGAAHLAAELLQSVTGAKLIHVPYKGGAQAVTDLVGGQLPLLFSSLGRAMAHVQAGRIRTVAVTSLARAAALPDVPTVAEQGYPGFEASVWFAMVGPAKLPAEIVAKANAALNSALADPAVKDAIRKQGYDPIAGTPAECARMFRADYEKWGKVIRDAGISFE